MKALKIVVIVLLVFLGFAFIRGLVTDDNSADDTLEIVCPWDERGAKQPSDYTWEEFEALSGEQQIEFQKSFGKEEKFEEWMDEAQMIKVVCPWDEKGAKQPKDYTWEEFEALSAEQQIVFQQSFRNIKDFDKWLTANQP